MRQRSLMTAGLVLALVFGFLWWASHLGSERRAVRDLPVLTVTVFAAPSQSIWFPTIIQKRGLDVKNGFRLEVKQKPSDVAYAEFASGVDKVCYCAGTAAVARFIEQGSDITLLWNVFSTEYVLVTNNPEVRQPTDIIGRKIASDTGTGNYAIAAMLLTRRGVDLDRVHVQSARGATQAALLAARRVDALLVTPVEAGLLIGQDRKDLRIVPLLGRGGWRELGLDHGVPHISFGVWRDWMAVPRNADLAQKFYRANVEAVAFAKAHPEEAADIVSSSVDVKRASVLNTLKYKSDFIRVAPISEYRAAIRTLTTQLLPEAGMLDRPMRPDELARYVSDFDPDKP